MSPTGAWLVLIAGVSLLAQVCIATGDGFELNAQTCNKRNPEDSAFTVKCWLSEHCVGGSSDWQFNKDADKLNKCPAMIAIRSSPDGMQWLVVMQYRISDPTGVNHGEGLKLIMTEAAGSKKKEIKCHTDGGKPTITKDDQINGIKFFVPTRFSYKEGVLTLCEFLIGTESSTMELLFTNLAMKYQTSDGLKQSSVSANPSASSLVSLGLGETDRCNFLSNDDAEHVLGGFNRDLEPLFYVHPSLYGDEVTCAAPNENVKHGDKYLLKTLTGLGATAKLTRAKMNCKQRGAGNWKYKWAEPPYITQQDETKDYLKSFCVANACSMCDKPVCPDSDKTCPEFKASVDGSCVTLNCTSGVYIIGDDGPIQGTEATCVKEDPDIVGLIDNGSLKQKEAKTKWMFGGKPLDKKLRCGEALLCPELKEKTPEITANKQNATCKEDKRMSYEDQGGNDVFLLMLRCNASNGVWLQIPETKGVAESAFDVANLAKKLRCMAPEAPVAAASTSLYYAGGACGVVAVIVLIIVIVYCCCCKRKKKTDKAQHTGGSMTAVSSGDFGGKKSSENSLQTGVPKSAPPSVPVTFEPLKSPPAKPVPPRSDTTTDPVKKEETKKEFLKFDDSNMSEVGQQSKKPDETERLDVLQQEAERLSQEQKQKDAEKKNLYPRLADIDDDWNDSKEGAPKKEEKKPGVPSDKTTVQSKLTSRPLHPAPHDDGQYEALGMQTVMAEKTAIDDKTKTDKDDESGTSKRSTKTRTKMAVADAASRQTTTTKTKTGLAPTDLQTALDAKIHDESSLMAEKTAILNDVEEGETQQQTATTMGTGKTRATMTARTQSRDRTTVATTQGATQGTTQRTRTQTRTRGDPTQIASFDGMTARDPTEGAETQAGTEQTQLTGNTADPTQLTDGRTRTGRERTANDVTQMTDGMTAKELTPVDFTQPGTLTGRTARSRTRGDETQMITEGHTAMTKTRATRTQDQTTRTADQETQDPTMINDPTQMQTRTRHTSRTQDGTNWDATQGPTTFDGTQGRTTFDGTQVLTDGRTGMTKTRASRTQMTRTGTTQDQTAFTQDQTGFTQDPTAFDGTQTVGGGRTRTGRTQDTRTGYDPTQDPTTLFDQTQAQTDGRTGMTKTRASRTQSATRTGTTQDQTAFTQDQTGFTQDPTAFDGTQLTSGGRTRTSRTQAGTSGTQVDPTRTGMTQVPGSETEVETQITDGGRTALTRTRARTTQEQTRDPTGTQEPTMALDGATQLTDGRTGVTKTRASRTQDTRTPGRTQDPTTAFDGTQVNTDGKTAVSRTKARTTQDGTTAADGTQLQTDGKTAVSRTKARTTQDATAFDGTQVMTDGKTAVSRTKARTTQDATVFDGTQVPTDGKTAVSRTKGRTTQDGTTAVNDGTQVPTEGQTAISKTKGRTTQDPTAFDGTQIPTDGKTAVSRTKGRTTQDGTTAVNDGTQVRTEGRTAVSRTKAGRTQEPTTAATRGETGRTQEPTTAATRGQTTKTQEQTGRSRTKSQSGTKTPNETQAEGQTEGKERTRSKEKTTGKSRTGAQTEAQSRTGTGADGTQNQSAPSAPSGPGSD